MDLITRLTEQLKHIKTRLSSKWYAPDPAYEISQWLQDKDSIQLSPWWTEGIPDMDLINHGAGHPKNKTLKWFGHDTEQAFDSIKATPKHWPFTKTNVNYTFNNLGYRGTDFTTDNKFRILVSGCSHTFGIGLDDTQTWPALIERYIKAQHNDCKVFNLACPGGSNDWIARSIACAYETIKPHLVIACWTYPNRREAVWDSGYLWQLNTEIPGGQESDIQEFKSWFMTINESADYYNWMKNHWLINKTCKDSMLIETHCVKMNSIQNNLADKVGGLDIARDSKHFGPNIHKQFAKDIYEKYCAIQNAQENIK